MSYQLADISLPKSVIYETPINVRRTGDIIKIEPLLASVALNVLRGSERLTNQKYCSTLLFTIHLGNEGFVLQRVPDENPFLDSIVVRGVGSWTLPCTHPWVRDHHVVHSFLQADTVL